MAKYLMCSIRDAAVGAFTNPFVARSQNEAIRSFTDAVNDPKLPFGQHPADYALFIVGEWDDFAGKCTELTQHQQLCSAIECVNTVS